MALRLVDAAVDARADAVKFQTFKAERIITVNTPKAGYQQETTDSNELQLDMIRRLELNEEAHKRIYL